MYLRLQAVYHLLKSILWNEDIALQIFFIPNIYLTIVYWRLGHLADHISTNIFFYFREGDDIEMRCEVLGGNPTPDVTWWKDHVLLKSNPQFLNHKVTLALYKITIEELFYFLNFY